MRQGYDRVFCGKAFSENFVQVGEKQNKEAEGLSKGVATGLTLVRVCSLNISAQCLPAP